jgi:hypothetical protein
LLGDAGGDEGDTEADASGFFSRLRDSLGKSRRALTEQIAATAPTRLPGSAWRKA